MHVNVDRIALEPVSLLMCFMHSLHAGLLALHAFIAKPAQILPAFYKCGMDWQLLPKLLCLLKSMASQHDGMTLYSVYAQLV